MFTYTPKAGENLTIPPIPGVVVIPGDIGFLNQVFSVLLMVGTFDEPMNGDAMGVFTTREAAEEFVAGDPFVVHGVVAEWTVRPWNEVLTG